MAKQKQTQTIELDVIAKGLETTEKNFKKLVGNTGDMSKKAQSVLSDVEKIRKLIDEFGKEMPITQAKELQRLFEKIARKADDISQLENITIFSDKELKKFNSISTQIDNLIKKQEKLKELENKARTDYKDRINSLKTQKTVADPSGSGKRISLKPIEGKWKNEKELQTIASDGSDIKAQQAALAVLKQIDEAERVRKETLEEIKESNTSYEQAIEGLRKEQQRLVETTRSLTTEERTFAESTSLWAEQQAVSTKKAIESNQKLGNSMVDVRSRANEQANGLGKAAKALFSWTAVWNIGRRMLNEAISTVQGMDEALNGMAMVTGKSREEVDSYIPRIQQLSKETSTAMTELANLITEYTKQGRSISDSFILAEQTAKAAKIAGISATESIQYMTSAINGFNLAAKDATKVSDIFANVAAASATDYEQLAISLSKVSAQANLAGMSIEYTTALLAKGIETTQEAPESIGTALKTILARMRELSDYGKTLEDGGSVNSVETALAAAGIKLRTVNGEFRELEDIFNELGPKWDSLNTMQQQAIAQAVAGTRQQSRFVAIMQDWERTQELAAEAQDSAGASTAQYAVYAESMEAALTNLKTSWQEFIQSITSSKILISGIKFITNALTKFTNFLEKSPGLVKNSVIVIGGITAAMATINKLKTALGMQTDKETLMLTQQKQLILDRVKLEKQIQDAKVKAAETTSNSMKEELENLEKEKEHNKQIVEGYKIKLAKIEEQEKVEKRLAKLKEGEEARRAMNEVDMEGGYNPDNYSSSFDPVEQEIRALEQQKLEIEQVLSEVGSIDSIDRESALERILALERQEAEIKKSSREAEAKLTEEKQIQATLENQLNTAQQEYEKIVAANNNPMIKRLETMKKALEVQKAQLQLELAGAKTEQEKERIKQRIAKVDQRITNINKKQQKLQQGTKKLIGNIGNAISTTILNGLQKVFNQLGPIGEILNSGLNSLLNWGTELLANLAAEKLVSKEKEKQVITENTEASTKTVNTALTGVEKVTEGQVTKEKEKQVVAENTENVSKATGIGLTTGETAAEIAQGKVKDANNAKEKASLGTKISSALVTAAKSVSENPIWGWVVGLALLAAAGIAVGVSAASSARKNSTANKESDIQKNNNTIYNKKKENSQLKSNLSEFQELNKKSIRTKEEDERLEELTSSIQDLDESFAGLTGDDLAGAVMGKISDNTTQINNLANKNLELAYEIKDLNHSTIGQQAVANSLIASQEKLIESNDRLWELNNEQLNKKVAESSAAMAKDLSKSIDYNDYLKTDKFTFGEGAAVTSSAALAGAAIGSVAGPIGAFIGTGVGALAGLIGSLVGSAENKKQREKEQAELQSSLRYYNTVITDAATTMEIEMSKSTTSLSSQIKTYDKLVESFGDNALLEDVLSNQYSTVSFLHDITSADDQVLSNIDALVRLNAVTEEGISKLASLVAGIEQEETNVDNALKTWDNSIVQNNGSNNSWSELAKQYGLSGDFTMQQLKDAMMSTVAVAEDGSYRKDSKGNYRETGGNGVNNKEFTNIIKEIDKVIQSGYGNYSKAELEDLKTFYNNADPKAIFSNFINGMSSALIDANGNEITDPQKQVQAMMNVYDSSSAELEKYLEQETKRAENLKKSAQTAKEQGNTEQANEFLQQANNINKKVQQMRTEFENTYKDMIGNMDNTKLSSFVQSLDSSIDKAQGLKDKISEGSSLEIDDFEFLRDTVIPSLQESAKKAGESFDATQFMEDIQQGNLSALEKMNEFVNAYSNDSINTLSRNVAVKQQEMLAAKEKMLNATEEERAETEANYKLAEATYVTAKAVTDQAKAKLKADKADLVVQEKLSRLQKQLEALENEEDILRTYKQQISVLKQITEENKKKYDDEIKKSAQSLGITEEQLRNYMKMRKARDYDAKQVDFVNKLSADGLKMLNEQVEKVEEIGDTYEENLKSIQEKTNSLYEAQIDYQDQIIEALKSKLQEEQDAVQDSLDKRKDMYDKYFESLQEEEDDTDFENEQARLQKAIASLSGATDATSLSKLKEYQQQLNDLEKEQRQTERDRRKDALDTYLDNQEEKMNQYYEDRLNNEQELWNTISSMTEEGITDLMTKYSEDYKNATDLNKMYMLQSYKELHMNLMEMMGNTEGAAKARQDYENYQRYLAAYASDSSIGKYNSSKAYSTGGLVDYTGLAMVHGSSTKPEAFLNAEQTAMFASLTSTLQTYYSRLGYNNNAESQTSGVTIENFTVAVDATLTNDNVAQTGESLADALLDGLRRTGISVNMKK